MTRTDTLPPGHVISHYRLLGILERESVATIYRARDLRLDRDVAVRILSPPSAAQPGARERFRREARVASLVSHPHICAVHDSGEEDGTAFLVCELLEGATLDRLVHDAPQSAERVLDIGIQIVDALAAMHARGLVHGSLQPSNVFITAEGHVKLLNVGFMTALWESTAGPAPAGDSTPTVSVERRAVRGVEGAGIHAFQSPEQVAGERLDHRTDLYGAGAVLYFAATRRAPFAGADAPALAGAIVSGAYVPVDQRSPQTPSALAAVIDRALRRPLDERYGTAAEMLVDLRRARRRLESTASGAVTAQPPRRSRRLAIALALLALAVLAVALAVRGRFDGPAPVRHAVLLGSIANGTNDPDFDGTLRQALIVHLGQSPFLDLVSDERLREILQMMGRADDAPLTHDVAREACQRLGLNAMVEGSVSAVGRATLVALVATDCATGETIIRDQIEVELKEGVLRAVGGLASNVRTALGESAASLEQHNVPIEEATTPSLEALKAYTVGASRRAAGSELESIRYFERAIELDPSFALAYTVLSSIYGSLGETDRGEEYARRAFEHRGSVTERERLFIEYQYHDRVTGNQLKAREALEYWARAYPRDYRPSNALAVLLNRVGDYERAIAEAQEALRRNPSHAFPYSNLAYAYRGAGRYDEARGIVDKVMAMHIETVPTRRLLYQLAQLSGDAATAEAQLEWARPRAQGFDLTGAHAQVLAFQGRMVEARATYERTVTLATRNGFPQIGAGYAAQAALTESLYGNRQAAAALVQHLSPDTTYAPRLRAAAALALSGGRGAAEAELRRFRGTSPDDTMLHAVYLPIAEAAVRIADARYAEAIDTLRRASAYERGFVAALLPMFLRAEARFRAGEFADAAADYRALLDTRGADPFSPVVPLAHVGLARALARTGDPAGSARAYGEALAIWRDADDDFAPARTVRAEAAGVAR